jgi:hypothetical protein
MDYEDTLATLCAIEALAQVAGRNGPPWWAIPIMTNVVQDTVANTDQALTSFSLQAVFLRPAPALAPCH